MLHITHKTDCGLSLGIGRNLFNLQQFLDIKLILFTSDLISKAYDCLSNSSIAVLISYPLGILISDIGCHSQMPNHRYRLPFAVMCRGLYPAASFGYLMSRGSEGRGLLFHLIACDTELQFSLCMVQSLLLSGCSWGIPII